MAGIDWLLGTHLLTKTTSHWQQKIETMQTEISSLEARMAELNASRGAILRHLCLSYLQLRQAQSPENWFHFDPRVPAEEDAIEILTRSLVTPHLARWKINQIAAGGANLYTYDLIPDWGTLHQDALNHGTRIPTNLFDWLAEQAAESVKQHKQGVAKPTLPER
ncbi:MAG: hypothetical protein JSV81_15620 [Anaerolineales bacterium]|nr:MAG: hypothetical protein JSV81_15620 [Anaerolineales bacterium]